MPENRKPQHRLDPRKPLVLDTRELGRRPGSMRTVRFPAPAPDDLRVELIGVSRGSEIDLDLRLESVMEGDFLDLEPTLRDAVVLALPLTPLCREDCAGLCAECGERLDDLPEDHVHDAPDDRWSALQDLLDTRTTEEK